MEWLKNVLEKFGPASGSATGEDQLLQQQAPVMPQLPAEVPAPSVQNRAPAASVATEAVVPLDVQNEVKRILEERKSKSLNYTPDYVNLNTVVDPKRRERINKEKDDILSQLSTLRGGHDSKLQEATDKDFNSNIWTSIGNYLPGAIAGATAMNTKASVKPAEMPKIEATNRRGEVTKGYQEQLKSLMDNYKALTGEGLTPGQILDAQKTNAFLKQGATRIDLSDANHATGSGLRGLGLAQKAQEKDELSDKQIDSMNAYEDTLKAFDRTKNLKDGVSTGPIQDIRNAIARKVGWDDPKVSALRAQVTDTLSERLKYLSGTAVNEAEFKRLQITLPSMSDSPETFERLLNDAEKRIRESMEIRKKSYSKYQGKNIHGYTQPGQQAQQAPASSGPAIGSIIRNGNKRYRVINDKGDLEEVK
jgi:hypothetical protein